MISPKKLWQLTLGVSFLLLCAFRFNGEYFYSGSFFGTSTLIALIFLYKPNSLTLLLGYLSLLSFYILGFSQNVYFQTLAISKWLFFINTSFTIIASFIILIIHRARLKVEVLFEAFGLLNIINSVYVILGHYYKFGYLPEGVGVSGLLNYAGLNGCLVAASLPFTIMVFKPRKYLYPLLLLPLSAIILSKSSVPYGVLFLSVTGMFLPKINKGFLFILLILLALIFLTAYRLEGNNLFNSAYRIDAYKVFIKEWIYLANIKKHIYFFGTGPGTFFVLGREIQQKTGFMMNQSGGNSFYWTLMHNDFLQAIFETGFIGALLGFLVILKVCFHYFYTNRYAFGCALGFLGTMLFNYPLRYMLTLTFGVTLILGAYNQWQKEVKSI